MKRTRPENGIMHSITTISDAEVAAENGIRIQSCHGTPPAPEPHIAVRPAEIREPANIGKASSGTSSPARPALDGNRVRARCLRSTLEGQPASRAAGMQQAAIDAARGRGGTSACPGRSQAATGSPSNSHQKECLRCAHAQMTRSATDQTLKNPGLRDKTDPLRFHHPQVPENQGAHSVRGGSFQDRLSFSSSPWRG